jgi:hypothetical protein
MDNSVLNLSSTKSQQRNMNMNNSDRSKSSNLSKAQQIQQQQVAAQAQLQAFDLLATPFGGDLGAAVAALAASNASLPQMDNSATLAQINALAQLNQLAATNPKIAAAAMLQFQQQLGNQGNVGAASSSSSLLANNFSQSPSMLPTQHMQSSGGIKANHTRYQQLLSIVDEMGKDIRNTYLGNKNSTERLKRSIASARILVKDCQLECERNTKQ